MKYGLKYAVIPIILLSTYILLVNGEGMLGRPYDKMPDAQFEFLDYRVTRTDGQKKIEIWIVKDKKSRLHVIDYSEGTEKQLAKAKSARSQGSRVQGEFKMGKGNGKTQDGFAGSLNIEVIPLEQILPPKDQ
jgi:hypothetical protein